MGIFLIRYIILRTIVKGWTLCEPVHITDQEHILQHGVLGQSILNHRLDRYGRALCLREWDHMNIETLGALEGHKVSQIAHDPVRHDNEIAPPLWVDLGRKNIIIIGDHVNEREWDGPAHQLVLGLSPEGSALTQEERTG